MNSCASKKICKQQLSKQLHGNGLRLSSNVVYIKLLLKFVTVNIILNSVNVL